MIEEQGIPAFETDDPFAKPPTSDERLMVAGRWDLLGPALKSFTSGKRTKPLREEGIEKIGRPQEASPEEMDALNQTLGEMEEEAASEAGLSPEAVEVRLPDEENVAPHIQEMASRTYGGGRTQKRNLNFDYMDSTDAAKSYVNALSEDAGGFMEQRRGVRTHEQTKEAAQLQDLGRLIGGKPGTAWNAEQLVAGRQLILRLAEEAMELSSTIERTGGSTEQQAKLLRLHQTLTATQRAVQGGVAEAGRALNSMQITAGPAYPRERIQQLEEIVARGGGSKNVKDLAAVYNKAINPEDAAEDAAKLAPLGRRIMRSVQEMWINSILSGVPTHAVNFMGNSLAQVYETAVVKPVAIPVGMARQGLEKLSGQEVQSRMIAMELPAEIVGKTQGILDTFIAMYQDRLDYLRKLDAEQKIDNPEFKAISSKYWGLDPEGIPGKTVDAAGAVIRTPGTVLAVTDDMFKSMVYRGEVNAQAIRQAQNEGLYGKAFSDRVYELMQDPTGDMHLAAKEESERLTYTASLRQDFGPLQWFGSVLQAGGEKYPLLNFFVPFKRTPTQIAGYMLENSVLSPMTTGWRADIKAGGIRADKAMARLTAALATTWAVSQLAMDGRITGNGPRDYNARRTLEATGWQAQSVLIDGKYYAIDRLDPIGGLLLNVANAVDLIRYGTEEETNTEIFSAMVGGVLQNFSSKTYMEGFHQAVGIIAGGANVDREIEQWTKRTATGFVPFSSLFRTFRRGDDEVVRVVQNKNDFVQTMLNGYANMVPGYSETLPPLRHWNGEIVTIQGGHLWRSMSPIRQSALTGDKASIELANNGIQYRRLSYLLPFKTSAGVPLNLYEVDYTGKLYDEYLRLVGEARKKEVDRAIKMMGNKKLFRERGTDTNRADMLRKAMRKGKQRGTIDFEKYYRRNYRENGWPRVSFGEVRRWEEINEERRERGEPPEGPFEFDAGKKPIIPEEVRKTLESPPEF